MPRKVTGSKTKNEYKSVIIENKIKTILRKLIKEEIIRVLGKKTITEAVKGLNLEQPHSNLYIKGWELDSNGNSVIIVGFPNDKGFSIQTNGTLPETNNIIRRAHKELSEDELNEVGREITDYVQQHGSKQAKARLRVYNKSK